MQGVERGGNFGRRDVADDEHVDVAVAALLARGQGAEQKRDADGAGPRLGDGRQRPAQHVGDARGLDHERLQFRKQRAGRVRLVQRLVSPARQPQDAGRAQSSHLALHRPDPAPGAADDLAQVQRLVRPPEQQSEHRPAHFAEESDGERIGHGRDSPAPHDPPPDGSSSTR